MKHRLFFLIAGIAVLGQSVGCLYPEHDQRRRPRPEQRRGEDHDQRHDQGHDDRHDRGLSSGLNP